MKRLHVHVRVADLERSVQFYVTLFGAEPTVLKDDYAKWLLDDPRVNFAVSARGGAAGISHLGIEVEGRGELARMADALETAGREVARQSAAACCYAVSDKAWVRDPEGVPWETFASFGAIEEFGRDGEPAPANATLGGCC